MNITVNEDRTVEKKYTVNEGSQNENRITELTFTLPEAYTDFVHKIVFITEDGNYTDYIENNTYILKNNVTKYRKVKSYVWLTETSTNKDFRSELFELEFNYNEDPSDYIPTEEEKSQIELLMEELDEKIEEVTALEENVYTKTETNTLLEGKISTSQKGANNGVAELDSNGKVPSSQLPSYVDDIIEGYYYNSKFYSDSSHTIEITPENGKIYVDLSSNKTYRWSGTAYVEISESLALGETSSTAYRGDRGKIAYEHATDSNRVQTAQAKKFYKVGVTAEGHISEIEEVAKSDLTALGVEDTSNKVTELDASDTHYPSSNAVKKVADALDDKIDENTEDIEELGNILYGREELESTNSEISFTGNENLDFSITEIDGKAEQNSYEGYNLLDINTASTTIEKASFTKLQTGYTVVTTNEVDSSHYGRLMIETSFIDSNKTYAISCDITCSDTYASGELMLGWVGASQFLRPTPTANTKTHIFGTLSGITTTMFSIASYKPNATMKVENLQIYEGSTDKTYEPYTGGIASPNPDYKQDVKVVTGENKVRLRSKNLVPFPYSSQAGLIAGVTWSVNADGTINASGTADSTSSIFYLTNGDSDIYLDAGTYKISSNLFDDPHGFSLQAIQIVNGNYGTVYYNNMVLTERTRLRIRVIAKANTTVNVQNGYMMIEEGSTATAYQPYYLLEKPLSLGNMELAQIENYKDYIFKNLTNDKWYKRSNVVKQIVTSQYINGLVAFNLQSINSYGIANFLLQNTSNSEEGVYDYIGLCNYLSPQVSLIANEQTEGILYQPRNVYIRIKSTTASTNQEFKTYVDNLNTNGNPLIIYRPLRVFVDTEITDTTLISQLEAIQKIQQITGTNIVDIVSTEGNLNPEFKINIETDTISYIKDNFVKKTDYATATVGGAVKIANGYGIEISNVGQIRARVNTYANYQNADVSSFVGKGTLDNVLNVVVGDINTILDQMNREVV